MVIDSDGTMAWRQLVSLVILSLGDLEMALLFYLVMFVELAFVVLLFSVVWVVAIELV
jgi:hypothetical protein